MKVAQSCLTFCDPMDCTVHGILQAKILEWVAFPFSRGSSSPGIEPRSPALQADSLPAEPQGKPKNTGAGTLSLLQQIFLSQELNQGLLHCRWFLYQLSYGKHATVSKNTYIGVTGCTLGKILIAETCTCSSICDGCQFHDQFTLPSTFQTNSPRILQFTSKRNVLEKVC